MITFSLIEISIENINENQQIDKIRREKTQLGTDLKMLATGNLLTKKKGLDIAIGIQNFAQAITHRLMTVRGEHPEDASVGVPWNLYLGATYDDANQILADLGGEILTEVYKDYRTTYAKFDYIRFADSNIIEISLSVTNQANDTANISLNAVQRGE